MMAFFYICEYLEIEPKDFFDFSKEDPKQHQELMEQFQQLDPAYLEAFATLASGLVSRK